MTCAVTVPAAATRPSNDRILRSFRCVYAVFPPASLLTAINILQRLQQLTLDKARCTVSMMIIRMPSASLQMSRSVTTPTRLRCCPTLFCASILGVLGRCRPSVTLPRHRWVRGKIAVNPGHNQSRQLIDLLSTQFSAPRNMVPFFDASAAAACSGVLGREHRMTTPRRLSPVFRRLGRANPLGEHLMRVPVNEFTPFAPRIFSVVRTQRE